MFDTTMYNKILSAVGHVLRDNLQTVGRDFANGFMQDYDLGNGQHTHRNANDLFNYVVEAARQVNGSPVIRDNDQLFGIVGSYIKNIYHRWQQQNARQTMGAGGFGFSNSGGFGFTQIHPASLQSGDLDTEISNRQRHHSQPLAMSDPALTPTKQQSQPENIINLGDNPLDDVDENNLNFVAMVSPLNWGFSPAKDNSIIITSAAKIKTQDERYQITSCDGLARMYYNNPLDVVKNFFDIAPKSFLGEHFIFKAYYNHVEEINIPTAEFIDTKRRLTSLALNNHNLSIYNSLIVALNEMLYGPRTALANYLVKHINRALKLSCGMAENPNLRISFDDIEDLEVLLGPDFKSRLLQVPNAKETITKIVNTAIVNALSGYSDPMFTLYKSEEMDIIKTSPAFPYSIENVYPNKLITCQNEDDKKQMYENLNEYHLNNKTYIRSIRSVLITNILGRNVHREIGKKARYFDGKVNALLQPHILNHAQRIDVVENNAVNYDEIRQNTDDSQSEYAYYNQNRSDYEEKEQNKIINNMERPKLPVDQYCFAIQYKVSPNEYILPFDLLSAMDANDKRVIMAKAQIDKLNIVS